MRATSCTGIQKSSAVTAVICGLGPYGYIAAMDAITQMAKKG